MTEKRPVNPKNQNRLLRYAGYALIAVCGLLFVDQLQGFVPGDLEPITDLDNPQELALLAAGGIIGAVAVAASKTQPQRTIE